MRDFFIDLIEWYLFFLYLFGVVNFMKKKKFGMIKFWYWSWTQLKLFCIYFSLIVTFVN